MRFIRSILVLASLLVAFPLAGQAQPNQTAPKVAPNSEVTDSLELKLSPELRKSLDELARSVEALALRIANDPHLRAAAVHVATGFVTTAPTVVAVQGDAIWIGLRSASYRMVTSGDAR